MEEKNFNEFRRKRRKKIERHLPGREDIWPSSEKKVNARYLCREQGHGVHGWSRFRRGVTTEREGPGKWGRRKEYPIAAVKASWASRALQK